MRQMIFPNAIATNRERNNSQEGGTEMRKPTKLPFQGGAACVMALALLLVPSLALAAPNQGTGDIAGVDSDLTNSNVFNVNSTTLALIKRAFANGAALTDGDSVPRGTIVKFMIYIHNPTPIPVTDITIQDVLDSGFTYVANSIKVDNTGTCVGATCLPAEELVIFNTLDLLGNLSDTPGNDVASFDTVDTIDIGDGNEGTNAQADILGSVVYAVLLSATVN